MYICLCHPFSDKKVREHLEKSDGRVTVSNVYGACSNGEKPECCSCLQSLKEIVKTHNRQKDEITA
ncbi:MAG: bacterioferritin-associated ferredoxin [Alphaproteobacteria bacterium]